MSTILGTSGLVDTLEYLLYYSPILLFLFQNVVSTMNLLYLYGRICLIAFFQVNDEEQGIFTAFNDAVRIICRTFGML